ncbi:MAG TPA: hypothetical protein VFB21_17130, partial [Chthonomonadaceae bacterium]|nr:hypothetical protein [Chthonomonadaceae bacterium]
MQRRFLTIAAAALLGACLAGCKNKDGEKAIPVTPAAAVPASFTFAETTREAGIDFRHVSGAFGKKWLPETMGSGLAWIDYDGDGYQDVYFVNSREWTDAERASAKQPPNPKKG